MKAKKARTHVIEYIACYEKDEQGYLLLKKELKFVKKDGVNRYGNCLHKLHKLTKMEMEYLFFLTEEMDKDNFIAHTAGMRKKFIKLMKGSCQVTYKDSSVKSAFGKLVATGLIISYGKRLDYTINPIYFFRGSQKSRKEFIRQLLNEVKHLEAGTKSNLKSALGI